MTHPPKKSDLLNRRKDDNFQNWNAECQNDLSNDLPPLQDPETAVDSATVLKQGDLLKGQKDGKLTLQNVSLPPIYIPFLPKREVHAHSPDEVVKTTQGEKISKCFLQINFDDYLAVGLCNICRIR